MVIEESRNLEEITCDKTPLPPIHMKSNSQMINRRKKSLQQTSPIKAILTNLRNSKYIARLEQPLTTKFKWHSRKFLPTDNTRYYSPGPNHPDSSLTYPSLPEHIYIYIYIDIDISLTDRRFLQSSRFIVRLARG